MQATRRRRHLHDARSRTRARVCAVACVLAATAALLSMATQQPADAASSSVNVTFTVSSATTLGASGCLSGTPGRTDFGTVQAGSSAITTVDCSITFGSTNDTSRLRLWQDDRATTAMHGSNGGSTDAAFSGDGTASQKFGDFGSEWAYDVAVAPDGKIVVVSRALAPPSSPDWGLETPIISRWDRDGTLDLTFGGGDGWVDGSFYASRDDYGRGVVVQNDGKILVSGHSDYAATTDAVVARYDATTGVLDPSFGTGGVARFVSPSWGTFNDIALLPDGTIAVAGAWGNGAARDTISMRLLPSGMPDPSFGTNGQRIIDAAPAASDEAQALDVAPDGTMALGGSANNDVLVALLDAEGAPVGSFSGDGVATFPAGAGNDFGNGVAIQDDGMVVVAGAAAAAPNDAFIARLTTGGVLDPAWNGGAVHLFDFGAATWGYDIALQDDGRAVVVSDASNGANNDYGLARFTTAGGLDNSFSNDGKLLIDVGTTAQGARSVAVADGAIVVGGSTTIGTAETSVTVLPAAAIDDFAIGTADWSTGANGTFGACLHTIGGGASNLWPVAGATNCTTALPANWRGISATSAGATAGVATAGSGNDAAVANLRFGVRVAADEPPGAFHAKLAFEVIAPNA